MNVDLATSLNWEHYRREHEPRSSGRVLLSHALVTHTMLNWGMSGDNVAAAFTPEGALQDRKRIGLAIRLFEEPLLDGRFATFARPFGGGPTEPLYPSHWEIDDFAPRFASSALNYDRPFDPAAEPTHWIFVENIVIEALYDLHRDDVGFPRRGSRSTARQVEVLSPEQTSEDQPVVGDIEGLLRLPDVERLAGMKKSTIYKRIKQGRFPAPVRNGERISSWRDTDVRAWLGDPR